MLYKRMLEKMRTARSDERLRQPLDEDVIHPAAAPLHEDADAGSLSVVLKAKLVNCEP